MNTKNPLVKNKAPLHTAIGLIWGWLDQGSFENALNLVQGCLHCWPDEVTLKLLEQQCLICLNAPGVELPLLEPEQLPPPWRDLAKRLVARQRLNQQAKG